MTLFSHVHSCRTIHTGTSKMYCSSAHIAVKLCTADLSVTTDVKLFFCNKIPIKFINNEIIIVANINNKMKIKWNII